MVDTLDSLATEQSWSWPLRTLPAQPSQVVVVGTANVVVSTIQAQGFVETTSLRTGRACRSFGAAVTDE